MIFSRYLIFFFKKNINSRFHIFNILIITQIILEIDKSLNISETTAEILSKKRDFQEFFKTHYRIQHYSFQVNFRLFFLYLLYIDLINNSFINLQIKKCNEINCSVCKPIRLPWHIFENIGFLPDPVPSSCKYV